MAEGHNPEPTGRLVLNDYRSGLTVAPHHGVCRNHQGTALLRACRQVPDWWTRKVATTRMRLSSWVSVPALTSIRWLKTTKRTGLWSCGFAPPLRLPMEWPTASSRRILRRLGHDVFTLRLEGDTTNGNTLHLYMLGVSMGKVLNIGTTWSCVQINFAAGVPTLFHNGSLAFTASGGAPVITGNNFVVGHTETAALGLTNVFANEFIIDELAFFNTNQTASTIYNSGVPKEYGDDYAGLIASYEVERDVGSITASFIPPRYTNTSLSPSSFVWGGSSTTGVVQITTNALISSDTNAFAEMCTAYGDYVRGTAVGGKTPLGTGVDLPDVACGLMPYPAGAGFSTLGYTAAFIGNKRAVRHARGVQGRFSRLVGLHRLRRRGGHGFCWVAWWTLVLGACSCRCS